jgi:type IV pilus assembly protein PilM
VLAAARSGGKSRSGQGQVYAFVPLPAGAVVPGIEEPNLRSNEAVTDAIRSALAEVSPRSRAVTLVLPDTLVRVFVLDFDSMPGEGS